MDMSVWIAGVCTYETLGVAEILRRSAVPVSLFCPGMRFCSGDVLVLCVSQAPLLGWWQYLKLAGWLSRRYDIRLLVLCPEIVYRSGVVGGRNIEPVNGERAVPLLTEDIGRTLRQNVWRRAGKKSNSISADFWNLAVCCLQLKPSDETTLQQLRREYQRRNLLLQETGFETLLCLRIFMAGYRQSGASFIWQNRIYRLTRT